MTSAVLAAIAIAVAQPTAPAQADPPKPGRAEIWNSEQLTFRSAILGRDVLIQIAKPLRPPAVRPPAVYLLDGNLTFPMVAVPGTMAGNSDQLAPAYFIGIAYPEQDVGRWTKDRGRDLVHADLTDRREAAMTSSGGGARFERFLIEELKPMIEARYATDPDRAVLAGNSLGGLFAAHVLVNNPNAFRDYLIGSPSLFLEPGLIRAAATLQPRGKPGRVFIGVGEDEVPSMIANAEALAAAIRGGSSGLEVRYWQVPDESHFSAPPSLYRRALTFLLPPLAEGTAAGQQNPDQRADMASEEAKLMQTSRDWSRAAAGGDVDAIVDYWAGDAVVMMPGLPTFRGKQAIRSYVEESMKIPGFRISWEPLEAHVSESGDMGYLVERTQVTMPDAHGKLTTQQSRTVTVWRKQSDGSWRNVVDISNAAAPAQ